MGTVITLIVIGGVLLLLETLLPGMVAGLLGALCLIAGILCGYSRFGARTGNLILLGVAVCLVAGTLAWLKYFPSSRVARVFISHQTVGDIGTDRPELLNKTGQALTLLRPSGMAMFDGKRVDVVTEGPPVEQGTPIKVVAIEGLRVVVRAV